MRPRDLVIEYWKSLNDSGTETIDLNFTDPCTELLIGFAATNHSTAPNTGSPPSKCVSKIEIVDGSDVLYSLSGTLAQANFLYDTGKLPMRELSEWDSADQIDYFPIRFGRWLYDKDLAFNPRAFNNPQLKITWNLAAVNSVGANGYATGSAQLMVTARLMEEAPAPAGFLMTKDIYDFTTAASGDERVELPTDWPYRRIMVRQYESGVGINSTISDHKLSVDADRYIPYNMKTANLIRLMWHRWGPVDLRQKIYADNGDNREVWLGYVERAVATAKASGIIMTLNAVTNGQATLNIVDHAGTAQTAAAGFISCQGTAFENTVAYEFGRPDEPAEWFPAQNARSVRLILTQANAGGSASVVLQQHRVY